LVDGSETRDLAALPHDGVTTKTALCASLER